MALGWTSLFQEPKPGPVSPSHPVPVGPDVELSGPSPAPCLLHVVRLDVFDDNGVNLLTCKEDSIKPFLYNSSHGYIVSTQQ